VMVSPAAIAHIAYFNHDIFIKSGSSFNSLLLFWWVRNLQSRGIDNLEFAITALSLVLLFLRQLLIILLLNFLILLLLLLFLLLLFL
jgi:hypothetical protein